MNIPLRFVLNLTEKMMDGDVPARTRDAREEHEEETGLRRRGKEQTWPNSPARVYRGGEEEGSGRAPLPSHEWPGSSGGGAGRGLKETRGTEQGVEEAQGCRAVATSSSPMVLARRLRPACQA